MGPWGRFRMVLDGKSFKTLMPDALNALIVQILMDNFHLIAVQAFYVHAKPVVLACDRDGVSLKILDRMIGTVMAEFQFICLAPQRQSQDLIAQAYAKQGHLA